MIVYRELSSLAQDLGIPAKTLYAVSNSLHQHYRYVQIPKKSGGIRCLSVPDEILKKIQRSITSSLLVHMPVSGYATAYLYGSSTVRNAQPHVGKHMVLKLDIYHFFDHILYSSVKEKAFPSTIYSEPIRILLAMLCYYRDALPQGAPSSPAITNIVMYEFDNTVGSWCAARNIAYTRYCDDMTFSGSFDRDEVIRFVRRELRRMGFLLNEEKTRLIRAGQRQTVTGIVVNEKPNVPAQYRRKLRQELYFCRKYGVAEHVCTAAPGISPQCYLLQLLGRTNYVLQVAPGNREMEQYRDWLIRQLSSR